MQTAAQTGRSQAVGLVALLVCSVLGGAVVTSPSLAAVGTSESVESVADETAPTADAGSNRTVAMGTELAFNGSDSSDDRSIEWYLWDVDGDNRTDAMGERASYEFDQPGVYAVALTVIDSSGNTDTDTIHVTVRDRTPPTADTGPNETVGVGSSVLFVATGSSDNHRIDEYRWDFDNDGRTDATDPRSRRAFETAGTYEVTLTVTDAADNADTENVTVTVTADRPVRNQSTTAGTNGTATDRGGSDGTDDSGSATASGVTDGAERTATDSAGEPDPVVSVTRAGNATTVEVAEASGPTTARLANATGTEGVPSAVPFRVDRLTVDATASEYSLTLSMHSTVPGNRSAPNRTETGDFDGGYLRVAHSLGTQAVSKATVAFTVGWPALAENTSAREVTLYRYHDGEWQALETSHVGYTEAGARFEARTSELTVLAVGERLAPNVTVEPSVERRVVGVEQAVNVSTRVTNDGTASKLVVVALRSDGTTFDTNSATLDANDSATLALRASFERPGTYDLVVEDTDAGAVTVTTTTATPTPTPVRDSPSPATTVTPAATVTPTSTASSAQTPAANATDGRSSEASTRSSVVYTRPVLGAGAAALGIIALSGVVHRRRRR